MQALELVVGAIAVGFLGRVLAAAQGDLGFGRQLEFDRGKVAAFVGAIAKGLGFGFAAGAPPVGARFELQDIGGLLRNFRDRRRHGWGSDEGWEGIEIIVIDVT